MPGGLSSWRGTCLRESGPDTVLRAAPTFYTWDSALDHLTTISKFSAMRTRTMQNAPARPQASFRKGGRVVGHEQGAGRTISNKRGEPTRRRRVLSPTTGVKRGQPGDRSVIRHLYERSFLARPRGRLPGRGGAQPLIREAMPFLADGRSRTPRLLLPNSIAAGSL